MNRLSGFGTIIALVLTAGQFTAGRVHAIPIPLGTLIDSAGTIEVGDKLFSNFSLSNVGGQNSIPADPRDLDIEGFTNLAGEHGLRLSGFSVILPNESASAALSFFLEYDVTVTDPSFRLSDIRHVFSTISNQGGSLSLITQAGFPPDVNGSMQSVVGFGGIDFVNEVRDLTNQVSSQHMLHAFEAHALEINQPPVLGFIQTSAFEFTYSQTRIPEPATWPLLATGLAMLIGLKARGLRGAGAPADGRRG